MADAKLVSARSGDEAAFRALVDGHRGELHVHCYRILGSLDDAEDAVQETLVSAWRSLDRFEQRASLRTWLYSIATNRCLNLLRDASRRPRTTPGLPFEVPPPTRMDEPLWLDPYPDALSDGLAVDAPGPESRYETREAVGLAFVTALQRLPARQRSVLVLRDVLGFRAAEVAGMLAISEPSVNSALQRARQGLEDRLPVRRDRAPLPGSAGERRIADQFADAFERGDVDAVVSLLTDDAWVSMPPEPFEYQGREAIAGFLRHASFRARAGGETVLVPTRANGQPAFGHLLRPEGERIAVATGVLVLSLEGTRISAITRFGGAGLRAAFGLSEIER